MIDQIRNSLRPSRRRLSSRRVRNSAVITTLACSALLSGCAVGPDFHTPAPPHESAYTAAPLPAQTPKAAGPGGGAQHFVMGAAIQGEWWQLFRSPELDSMMATALANNPSLAAAEDTLLAARYQTRAAEGGFLPSLSGNIAASRGTQFVQSSTLSPATRNPFSLLNADVAVSYAPDLFGGVRRKVEGLRAVAEQQRFALEAADLALTANVATAAITDASVGAEIEAVHKIITSESHALDILRRQVALGGLAEAAVLTQQAQLAQTAATLPPLEKQLAQARNQLAAYEGIFPAQFHNPDFKLADLHLPRTLPVSLPSALVEQRPDIREASALLHQDTAAVGIATANMLPQITLTGSVGHSALNAASLFTPQTLIWNLAAGLTQPIFEGGSLFYTRRAAIATMQAAAKTYQNTVVLAFQNVADTLAALDNDAAALAADQQAETASKQSLDVSEAQYRAGAVSFTAVLTAEQSYDRAVIIRVQATAQRYVDTAALFQALGGGWWQRQDIPPNVRKCCGVMP